jgi:hypothetical protein
MALHEKRPVVTRRDHARVDLMADSVEDEWYPNECPFCTKEAARACLDPVCRDAHLGEERTDA